MIIVSLLFQKEDVFPLGKRAPSAGNSTSIAPRVVVVASEKEEKNQKEPFTSNHGK